MSAARAAYDRYGLESARSIDELTSIVSAGTGKDIVVRGVNDPDLVMTTALWIEFPDRSLIILRDQDRPYYKARGLFHELGHIVFQHPACTLLGSEPEMEKYTHPGGQIRGRVLISEANLPALYGSDRHESEAEAVATLIGRSLLKPSFDADEKIFG